MEAHCANVDACNALHIEALKEIFQIGDETVEASRGRLATELQRIAARILKREAFLETLGGLQRSFDTLDGDGAILVYRRLVDIFGGSEDQAEVFLESYTALTADMGSEFSHFKWNGDSSLKGWNDFLKEIESTEQTMGVGMDDEVYNRNYHRATELVKKFSLLTCGYLLQQWLASIALCDISFFLTICRADDAGQNQQQNNDKDKIVNTIVGDNGCIWNYSIKIIDCDPKPVSKLREREQKESIIRHFKSDLI